MAHKLRMNFFYLTMQNGMNNINFSELSFHIENSLSQLQQETYIFIWLSWWTSLDWLYPIFTQLLSSLDKKIVQKIRFCFLDERIVAYDDIESNYKNIYDKFFSLLLTKNIITENQIVKVPIHESNIAQKYSDLVPRIDIWFFGVGEDGHIASLFPRHRLLNDESDNFLEITDSPKFPAHRITISKNMIKNILSSFLFFIWEKKLSAYHDFCNENLTWYDCPAKCIKKSRNIFILQE